MYKIALATLLAALIALPGHADPKGHNRLDSGSRIGTAWASTERFSTLKALGPDDVRFTTGERWQLRAEGDPQTLARLRFIVEEGQLVIGRSNGTDAKLRPATIFVVAPALRRATVGGSGSLEIDRLTGKKVSASIAGTGNLAVGAMDADKLDASVAGSGAMRLQGRSAEASLAIAGSGDLKGTNLRIEEAKAVIGGSGSMAFRSNGRVSASIAGSGNISVKGTADCSRLDLAGSGTFRCEA